MTRSAQNALELVMKGRLGSPYSAPHEVVTAVGFAALRRYRASNPPAEADLSTDGRRPALLLVPPLMVTAEVYDISPELSAVASCVRDGMDVWLVDFGTPEAEQGGMDRTLSEHVLAVADAIAHVCRETGQKVHMVGYSQGGMFVYQTAAYLKGDGIASLVTLGSPVDMRRNLPVPLHDSLSARFIKLARRAIDGPLGDLEGLPGTLTSRGFKLLSPRQEVKHLLGVLGLLHDREALERRESKRRFLAGEGFIAWPGPAFRSFVDEFIVDNRMKRGGFVIGGRTVSLADIEVPILYFIGKRDDMGRPAAVRAIESAAPLAETHGVEISAGHFGLVVGSRAISETWPQVSQWVWWKEGVGPMPDTLRSPDPQDEGSLSEAGSEADRSLSAIHQLYDLATDVVDGLWDKLGDASVEVGQVVWSMRWQLPRLARLMSMKDDSRVNMGRMLEEQAEALGDETFFLWRERAFTYKEANARVNQLLSALVNVGVKPGEHVGVFMGNHPDYLTLVAALSRLGAVGVLLNADIRGMALTQAIAAGEVTCLVVGPDRIPLLGGELPVPRAYLLGQEAVDAPVPAGMTHLDPMLDPTITAPPEEIRPNPGRATDLAFLLFTSGTTGMPRAARITNRRWMTAAVGTAAACEIRSSDTVYCCLPLHHATGFLVACGGALAGGARLALAPRFSASSFWTDVRHYGASVVFYVGELCRYLVSSPLEPAASRHPVRLFAGNGMRPWVWERMQSRFGDVRVLEFYGSTEGNVVLANLLGDKKGAIGRELWTSGSCRLAKYDTVNGTLQRGDDGFLVECEADEAGVLLGRIGGDHPLSRFDGYQREEDSRDKIVTDAFASGDRWFVTGDLLRRDGDGDYWFVDRLGDTYRWKGENVSSEQVQSVIASVPAIALAAVYGVNVPGREGRAGMAAIEMVPGEAFDGKVLFDEVGAHLTPAARPRFIRIVQALEMTASLKMKKGALQREGADPGRIADPLYFYDADGQAYTPLDLATYSRLTAAS